MPTDKSKKFKVKVEYCGAWGYLTQAALVEKAMKACYPQAIVEIMSPVILLCMWTGKKYGTKRRVTESLSTRILEV
jgi:hypothetical protein